MFCVLADEHVILYLDKDFELLAFPSKFFPIQSKNGFAKSESVSVSAAFWDTQLAPKPNRSPTTTAMGPDKASPPTVAPAAQDPAQTPTALPAQLPRNPPADATNEARTFCVYTLVDIFPFSQRTEYIPQWALNVAALTKRLTR